MQNLTVTAIKNAKPKEKAYRISDGKGLYLEITPNGSKRWRFRYFFDGKEKLISLGVYPEISLKEARERHLEARNKVANDIDPSAERQLKKASRGDEFSFEYLAREWHGINVPKWSKHYGEQVLVRLEKNIFPWVGGKNIADITTSDMLKTLQRAQNRGAFDTAHRLKAYCSHVFFHAISKDIITTDPTQNLSRLLTKKRHKHFASITDPKQIGGLLRTIDGYEGTLPIKCALRLAPLVMLRPKELRCAEWEEIDIENAEWRIPAEKMKAGEMHIVPLSRQAIEIIEELRPLTGTGTIAKYLFPSPRDKKHPMSDNAVLSALRRMGFSKEEMTGHGFRSMASTCLNELGYNRDHIERQLAHAERNNVRAAYNYAEYLPERRKMMQEWADYLDELKAGGKVIEANFGR